MTSPWAGILRAVVAFDHWVRDPVDPRPLAWFRSWLGLLSLVNLWLLWPDMPMWLGNDGVLPAAVVIGPLTSAALRVVPSAQHGIASSLVVVARMTGMLIGVAGLSAWGLYRFNQILATLPSTPADTLAAKIAGEAVRYRTAFAMQYGSIFFITTIVCLAGAVFALFIGGRQIHADEETAVTAPSSSGAGLPG